MFNSYLYKFDKRINSTKIPPNTMPAGTEKEVLIELKDGMNIYNPVIVLAHSTFDDQTFDNPVDFNYAYLIPFKRYYFINSWSWENGLWVASLTVDTLGSFKTEIGNSRLYVLRSASNFDGSISDTKYPAKPAKLQRYVQASSNPWRTGLNSNALADGFYCVGILNSSASAVGATSYYAFTGAGMRTFIKKMFDSPSWLGVTDTSLSTDLQKLFLNPTQYVMSAVWIPLPYPDNSATPITSIPYGWWSLSGVTAYPMTTSTLSFSANLFDGVAQNNPYRLYEEQVYMNMQPWTTCSVECFPFGVIPIDTTIIQQREAQRIYVSCIMDSITGRAQMVVETQKSTAGKEYLASANAQVGVPIPMAQLSIDWGAAGGISTYVKTAAALVAKNSDSTQAFIGSAGIVHGISDLAQSVKEKGISGAWSDIRERVSGAASSLPQQIKAVAADIGNGLAMALGTPEVTGSAGGFAGLYRTPAFIWQHAEQVDQDLQHYGRPLCAFRTISSLQGFVLVQNGDDFTADCLASERAQIVQLLESGFYYE